MEIKLSSKLIQNVLRVLCWIIFIGLCIETGGILFNMFYTLFYNPIGAGFFWNKLNFSELFNFDKGHFVVITSIMSIIALLKTILFYLIVKLLHNKNLSLSAPYNNLIRKFIVIAAYLSVGIGFFTNYGEGYAEWLTKQGVSLPSVQYLKFGGADVWLFMGVILFVIAYVFKKGIELQEENDLTI